MSMRIWAEVFDPSGNRLGAGSINTLQGVSVRRVLDGAGSISFSCPATDDRALELLQNERRVNVYIYQDDTDEKRLLGGFIIQKRRITDNNSGKRLNISGPTELYQYARKSVRLALKYDNLPIATIVNDLAGYVSGWTTSIDAGLPETSIRFDGMSILKALIALAERNKLHLREGTTAQTLEFGAFGDSTGVRAYGPVSSPQGVIYNTDVLLIDEISKEDDSSDVVNWIIPLGAGEGDAALTLEKSDRTTPYTIQTITLPDGRSAYAIGNTASITQYGQNERVVKFNIAPLENSETAIVRAANALYDAAAASLDRSSQKQEIYTLSCKKPSTTLRAGDKLPVRYKGMVELPGGELVYMDINDDFWLLEVSESVTLDGVTLQLKIALVDQMQKDAVETIVGALEEVEQRQTSIQAYPVMPKIIYRREVDPTHTAIVPIQVSDATLSLVRCKVRIKTRPFRATAKSAQSITAEAGGSHRHLVAAKTGSPISSATMNTQGGFFYNFRDSGGVIAQVQIHGGVGEDLYTYDSADAHTHDIPEAQLTYGITDDNQTPDTISIAFNGTDITGDKGGPWLVGGGAGSFDIILTDEMIDAGGGLRQEHQLTISCTGGRGEVEVLIETIEIIQALAVL